jgi:hypothetical protein
LGPRYFSPSRDADRNGVLTAVRRVRRPDRRTSGKGGATSDALGARGSGVTPGRSPRSTRRRVGGAARAPVAGPGRDPAGCTRRRGAGGIDRDGTVTAAIPRPSAPQCGHEASRSDAPAGGPPSAPGHPESHRSSVPVAHRTFLPPLSVAIRQYRPSASPVPVAHGTAPSRVEGFRGGTSSPHQFQLRMTRSFPVVGPRGRTRWLRTIVRAAQRPTEVARAGCGRGGTR